MHPPGFGGGFGGMSSSEQPGLGLAPKGPPPFDCETSGKAGWTYHILGYTKLYMLEHAFQVSL